MVKGFHGWCYVWHPDGNQLLIFMVFLPLFCTKTKSNANHETL